MEDSNVGTTKTIKVTPRVRSLVDEAIKKVAVQTKGEIVRINDSLEYILKKFLKDTK